MQIKTFINPSFLRKLSQKRFCEIYFTGDKMPEGTHSVFEGLVDNGDYHGAYRFLQDHEVELTIAAFVSDGLSRLYIGLCRQGTYTSIIGMEEILRKASTRQ